VKNQDNSNEESGLNVICDGVNNPMPPNEDISQLTLSVTFSGHPTEMPGLGVRDLTTDRDYLFEFFDDDLPKMYRFDIPVGHSFRVGMSDTVSIQPASDCTLGPGGYPNIKWCDGKKSEQNTHMDIVFHPPLYRSQ